MNFPLLPLNDNRCLCNQGPPFGSEEGFRHPCLHRSSRFSGSLGALLTRCRHTPCFTQDNCHPTRMSNTFVPVNPSLPYRGGDPRLQFRAGPSLQQNFQPHGQAQRRTAAPKVPWTLSKSEKKSYDQIFRAYDTSGSGFITGQTALGVLGQSGLDKNDLARIWYGSACHPATCTFSHSYLQGH